MKKHIIITTIAFILGTACGVVGTVLVEKQDVQKEVTTEIATNTDATITEEEVITTEIATGTDATTEEVITTENITEIDTSSTDITTTEEVTVEVAEEISTTETYYEPITEEAPTEETTTEASSTEANGMTYLGTYSLTAYCSCVNCCGKSNGITASGTQATAGRTVACNSLSIGTVISINGHQYVVEDTGGMGGNVIDIFFDSHEEAINFGRQSAEVYLVN